ncbi:hypothetical protein [Emticicia agri]|uniref:Lipocalin-like domain-containing protein n=1 Tax=Emticicia agri TaxID=2492393 RepID=A0A4Q5LZM4_9BACT|nr:hypothetical protein [Emticicia agri]RYU95344.1 hypothetical protein EWM59_11790 [Emticicia agri]
MKKILIVLTLVAFVFACRDKTEEPMNASAKILTANYWKLDRYTDPTGRTLGQNEVGSQAQAIFSLDFEFRADNITRGRDRASKQILNAGTWYLKNDDKVLDIQITGFGGEFKVLQLSNNKLILQAENNKFIAASSTINLELVPSL